MTDTPVAQVGDIIKIKWDTPSNTSEIFTTTVKQVRQTSNTKHGSSFLYYLQFHSNEVRKTRLLNRQFEVISSTSINSIYMKKRKRCDTRTCLPSHKYILAPMVGGSELAFRMICRKYGTQLAYTPMINSEKFAIDSLYRQTEFQSTEKDRPLVAHFCGNNPDIMLKAALYIQNQCDAIDINLGCPQRIAHSGHFGSYLLDEEDRPLVLQIVHTLASNLEIPVFVKIRLLDTVEDTLRLCKQLATAGASLIAIHARHRVNLVGRTGAGARDGPALLDQVKYIKENIGFSIPIISNGNIITLEDAERNLEYTGADGVMSAEGILDNPALYFNPTDGQSPPSKLALALEYMDMVDKYGPVKMKSVIFHIRRICKQDFEKYQLLEDCLACTDTESVRAVVQQAMDYSTGKTEFVFDPYKLKRAKEAAARKKAEEGKRKAFEDRMIRKAKREGKSDLMYYLNEGAENPTSEELDELKKMSKDEAFQIWKKKHSQHCFAFHFEEGGCPRDRKCAFLHADARISEAVLFG